MCVKTQWGVMNVPVIMDSLYTRTNTTAKKVKYRDSQSTMSREVTQKHYQQNNHRLLTGDGLFFHLEGGGNLVMTIIRIIGIYFIVDRT